MKTAKMLEIFFLGIFLAAGCEIAYAQDPAEEPPAYPGNDAATPGGTAQNGGAIENASYFKDQLAPYGQWVGHESYGEVFVPKVDPTWRPYTNGSWSYTDQGWAWVAAESWGWGPFHYGRWFYDHNIGGWGWVPGTVWSPAWVAWRQGGGYLGWAPLPPSAGFSEEAGLDLGGREIAPSFFTFVAEAALLAPHIATAILPTARNVAIVHNTANITNYTVVDHHIINHGVSAEHIEQVTGRPVVRQRVATLTGSGSGGRFGAFYQPPALAKATPRPEFGRQISPSARNLNSAHERSAMKTREQQGAAPRAGLSAPKKENSQQSDALRRAQQLQERQKQQQQLQQQQQQRQQQNKQEQKPKEKEKEKERKPPQ
ncbi:MAG TPA: DUF6600 domain-containing protein [Thermoanaerobaculia bacterium]|nr:DUF6600 domain-containing protein [Thermoanaerobaculia bacterium]